MESRLPKPKFTIQRSITTTNIIMQRDNGKVTKSESIPPQTSSNGITERLKKAKSTFNINGKPVNENKPPPRPTVTRSKTMATIVRPTAAAKPVKRLGTTTSHGEAKKPLTRSVKATGIQNTDKGLLKTNSTAKPTHTTAGKNGAFDKWNYKARFALANEELTNVRQKNKEIVAQCSTLEKLVETLKSNESVSRHKAEQLETSNNLLKNELNDVKVKLDTIQNRNKDLETAMNEAMETQKRIANTLEHYQEKTAKQEDLLTEKTVEIESLRASLERQKAVNQELTTYKEDLLALVHTMDKDRRVLHNAIQELKGNIRVFCRVRPKTPSESAKPLCFINFIDECTIEVSKSDGSDAISCSGKIRGTKQEFSFDKVFPPNASQAVIFEELSLLVQSALEGYNVCVFAYGQTGSGKTYTMEGIPGTETEGMIPRTVQHIFQEMKQFQLLGWEYRIEASFLEIYNEHIVDLLDSQAKTHEIKMADSKGNDLYVSNLRIEEIQSPEELHKCLITAQQNRAVAATQANERSSRSHSVARIRLIGTHAEKGEASIGNLNLVDLAGSERLKGEEMARVAETKNINKSLANLGNVILALLKKQEHIPYRNSKLTHLLMPSLGGNSKTLMLLNISPLDECYNETLNSLRFASNVNSCKTGNVKRTRTILQNSL
ncbi:hypothetical protein KM043_009008 [Ampulex compressa]|nr:hypothetical protein KM043_009008 [Ampulex compressa]